MHDTIQNLFICGTIKQLKDMLLFYIYKDTNIIENKMKKFVKFQIA